VLPSAYGEGGSLTVMLTARFYHAALMPDNTTIGPYRNSSLLQYSL
jgi:hypothetical protein